MRNQPMTNSFFEKRSESSIQNSFIGDDIDRPVQTGGKTGLGETAFQILFCRKRQQRGTDGGSYDTK